MRIADESYAALQSMSEDVRFALDDRIVMQAAIAELNRTYFLLDTVRRRCRGVGNQTSTLQSILDLVIDFDAP